MLFHLEFQPFCQKCWNFSFFPLYMRFQLKRVLEFHTFLSELFWNSRIFFGQQPLEFQTFLSNLFWNSIFFVGEKFNTHGGLDTIWNSPKILVPPPVGSRRPWAKIADILNNSNYISRLKSADILDLCSPRLVNFVPIVLTSTSFDQLSLVMVLCYIALSTNFCTVELLFNKKSLGHTFYSGTPLIRNLWATHFSLCCYLDFVLLFTHYIKVPGTWELILCYQGFCTNRC